MASERDLRRAHEFVARMKREQPGPFGTGFGSTEALANEFADARYGERRRLMALAREQARNAGDVGSESTAWLFEGIANWLSWRNVDPSENARPAEAQGGASATPEPR